MKIPTILLAAAALGLAGCETLPGLVPGLPGLMPGYGPVMVTAANKAPYGSYLVDGRGRALYILEGTRNESGVSRCSGECLRVWPPLHATGGQPAAGPAIGPARLATIPMHGAPHVTYAGWPLYYYQRDSAPGDTTGQHVVDRWGTWHLLSPSGEPIRPGGRAY